MANVWGNTGQKRNSWQRIPSKTLVTQNIFQQVQQTLQQANARFRVVEHTAAGKCEQVAAIRSTALGQDAKALLCHLKGNGVRQHVLAVLSGRAGNISYGIGHT